jgi:hypothetical protein
MLCYLRSVSRIEKIDLKSRKTLGNLVSRLQKQKRKRQRRRSERKTIYTPVRTMRSVCPNVRLPRRQTPPRLLVWILDMLALLNTILSSKRVPLLQLVVTLLLLLI